MGEEIEKKLKHYYNQIEDGDDGTPLKSVLAEALDVIRSLRQENTFLKEMQKKLVKDVDLTDLGKMVKGALDCTKNL